jgi:hypothetical protein
MMLFNLKTMFTLSSARKRYILEFVQCFSGTEYQLFCAFVAWNIENCSLFLWHGISKNEPTSTKSMLLYHEMPISSATDTVFFSCSDLQVNEGIISCLKPRRTWLHSRAATATADSQERGGALPCAGARAPMRVKMPSQQSVTSTKLQPSIAVRCPARAGPVCRITFNI